MNCNFLALKLRAFQKKVRYLQTQNQAAVWKPCFLHAESVTAQPTIHQKIITKMTKADIVNEIAKSTGIDKIAVLETVEKFMEVVKESLTQGENVYLRGFGSFIIKTRSEKTARNISKNTTIIIPAHKIPAFKPAKVFMEQVKA